MALFDVIMNKCSRQLKVRITVFWRIYEVIIVDVLPTGDSQLGHLHQNPAASNAITSVSSLIGVHWIVSPISIMPALTTAMEQRRHLPNSLGLYFPTLPTVDLALPCFLIFLGKQGMHSAYPYLRMMIVLHWLCQELRKNELVQGRQHIHWHKAAEVDRNCIEKFGRYAVFLYVNIILNKQYFRKK